MAETTSGWLTSEVGDTPARRAFHLLGGFLDDDQKAEAERSGGFRHRDGERLYWIPIEGAPRCAFLREGRIEQYCIAPRPGEPMPVGDVALTYLLWIKADPDGFHTEAVVLRKWTFDVGADEAEIVELMAPSVPKPLAPRRRRRSRVRLDRPGLTRGSDLARGLAANELRLFLERNGRDLPDSLLARLALPAVEEVEEPDE